MENYKQQRSREWLEYRKDKVGASDAPVIMGLNPWKNARQLWEEKKNPSLAPYLTPAMKKGIDLESDALSFAEKQTGLLFMPDVVEHPINNRIMASLDGIDLNRNVICECKCSDNYYQMALSEKIFPYVMCQIQHQLMCTGINKAILCCYNGFDGKIMEVERDQEFMDRMMDEELVFLKRLDDDTPPSAHEFGLSVDITKYQNSLIQRWKETCEKLKAIEQKEKALKEQIISMGNSGDTVLKFQNESVLKIQKSKREGSVDWKALCKSKGIKNEEMDFFRKESSEFFQIKIIK